MTSKPRRSGGQSKAADDQAKTEVAAPAQDGEQIDPQPEQVATDGGNAAGEGATVGQQAAHRDMLGVPGDPEPEQVEQSMVRKETGLSPEPAKGEASVTAPFGDDERNGKAVGIPTDTSGELRHREDATPTAAFGQDAGNGHVTGMDAEGQLLRDFGGNGDSVARLEGSGVRGERGVGTLDRDLEPDERPTYPSTTLTRSSPDAAPMEPEDVRRVTEPKLGDVKTSTDPTMAAAAMPSMPGDTTVKLVNQKGQEVKPSEFFEVPEGIYGRNMRRVTMRVSEEHTVRRVSTPGKRLLFTEGQMVPEDVALTLIDLHG